MIISHLGIALSYAFAQFRDPGHWKFNKAKQNWLVRNFWSAIAVCHLLFMLHPILNGCLQIPEKYEELITKYLSAVQGNAREVSALRNTRLLYLSVFTEPYPNLSYGPRRSRYSDKGRKHNRTERNNGWDPNRCILHAGT